MKILFILLLIVMLLGCTTVQRKYIQETEMPDSIYLELSGFIGLVFGVGITSLAWYYYEQLQ